MNYYYDLPWEIQETIEAMTQGWQFEEFCQFPYWDLRHPDDWEEWGELDAVDWAAVFWLGW